jgi:hypothetical protein
MAAGRFHDNWHVHEQFDNNPWNHGTILDLIQGHVVTSNNRNSQSAAETEKAVAKVFEAVGDTLYFVAHLLAAPISQY